MYLRTGEVANELNVSRTCITNWVKKGYLKTAFTFPSGLMRFHRKDVEAFKKKMTDGSHS
ncbi:MAG TPA: helix-turn-helix domain-containing protein [Methylomirabilota bacterium]|nr:helix-turn-helix domain-containing protein [Methylomirabilota bacterium]